MLNVIKCVKKEISLIVHLGDCISEFKEITKHIYDIPWISIKGNNDFFDIDEQDECVYNFDGVKCFFTHGHRYGVKSGLDRITARSIEINAKLVAFGHTHLPIIRKLSNALYINPGTIGSNSTSLPTFAIVNIENSEIISANLYEYNPTTNSIRFRE